jgi:hypothetical protein
MIEQLGQASKKYLATEIDDDGYIRACVMAIAGCATPEEAIRMAEIFATAED